MKFILILVLNSNIVVRGITDIDSVTVPGLLLNELLDIIVNGTLEDTVGCTSYEKISQRNISYYLHTRENKNVIVLTLNNLQDFDSNKTTKVIFSGWLQNIHDAEIVDLVNAYLARYDTNVIVVNYMDLTMVHYTEAYCNMMKAGEIIGDFFCKMYTMGHLHFRDVHMLGLSLGAHLIGFIGSRVQEQCKQKIDRLTGLDPAGPLYYGQGPSKRLDKTDGNFVDVIHTNMGLFGYYGTLGNVDFFPNCGTFQPGCGYYNIICDHLRSMRLFTASINSTFNSTSCSSCPDQKNTGVCLGPDIIRPKHALMGEDCPRNPPAKKFVLTTTGQFPYTEG